MEENIIHQYFEHLEKGNIPALFNLFDTNVIWHQPGKNKFSGLKQGITEIENMIGAMMHDTNNTFQIFLDGKITVHSNIVAAPVHFKAEKANKNLNMKGVDLFKVENGKIIEVQLFSESQAAEDLFWGN